MSINGFKYFENYFEFSKLLLLKLFGENLIQSIVNWIDLISKI